MWTRFYVQVLSVSSLTANFLRMRTNASMHAMVVRQKTNKQKTKTKKDKRTIVGFSKISQPKFTFGVLVMILSPQPYPTLISYQCKKVSI